MPHRMTRAELAQKVGVPEPTLKDVEMGKFKLSRQALMKIAYACGVHPRSLRENEDPLRDFKGEPVTKDSSHKREYVARDESRIEARRELYKAMVEAALDKNIGLLMEYSFDQWLLEACQTFGLKIGLKAALVDRLTERLEEFDPRWIPWDFRGKTAEWEAYEEQILQEQIRVFESGWGSHLYEEGMVNFDDYRWYRCRAEAQTRVRLQRLDSKQAVKPRSAVRKAA